MRTISTLTACDEPGEHYMLIMSCRESTSIVKVFKNFKEVNSLRPGFSAEGIYGGTLLAVRTNDFICFYDWNTMKVCTSAAFMEPGAGTSLFVSIHSNSGFSSHDGACPSGHLTRTLHQPSSTKPSLNCASWHRSHSRLTVHAISRVDQGSAKQGLTTGS